MFLYFFGSSNHMSEIDANSDVQKAFNWIMLNAVMRPYSEDVDLIPNIEGRTSQKLINAMRDSVRDNQHDISLYTFTSSKLITPDGEIIEQPEMDYVVMDVGREMEGVSVVNKNNSKVIDHDEVRFNCPQLEGYKWIVKDFKRVKSINSHPNIVRWVTEFPDTQSSIFDEWGISKFENDEMVFEDRLKNHCDISKLTPVERATLVGIFYARDLITDVSELYNVNKDYDLKDVVFKVGDIDLEQHKSHCCWLTMTPHDEKYDGLFTHRNFIRRLFDAIQLCTMKDYNLYIHLRMIALVKHDMENRKK